MPVPISSGSAVPYDSDVVEIPNAKDPVEGCSLGAPLDRAGVDQLQAIAG